MGAAAIPLIMSAASAGMQYYNTQQTNKRQDSELARQIADQSRRQSEADALVHDALTKQRDSNPADEQSAALNQYLQQLQRTQGNATHGLDQLGAVSDRYTADAAGATNDIAATGANTADIFSRIDAPVTQRQNEGIAFGRLASDLDRIRARSASDELLGQIRMSKIQRNPFLDAAASAASAYGGSYGGKSGGADISWVSTPANVVFSGSSPTLNAPPKLRF